MGTFFWDTLYLSCKTNKTFNTTSAASMVVVRTHLFKEMTNEGFALEISDWLVKAPKYLRHSEIMKFLFLHTIST